MSNVMDVVRDRLAELHLPPDGPNNVQIGIRVDEVNASLLDFLATKLALPSRSATARFLLEAAMHDALGHLELVLGFDPYPVLIDGDGQVVVQLAPPGRLREDPDA